MGYTSVYKFSIAIGLPEKRIDAWERGAGIPKAEDSVVLAKFFGITSEELHNHKFTAEEIKSVVASRNISQEANHNFNSKITQQVVNEPSEIYHLKEKITLLENQLIEKERLIQSKDQVIDLLKK